MLTRRSVLQALPFLVAPLSLASRASASPVRAAISRRYIVQIVLSGGIDPLFFTDPKERSEVDADVDIPYPAKDILSVGNVRFGPLMQPLLKWAPRMTIVNGVVLGTANHPAGLRQLAHLRNGAVDEMPVIGALAGKRRDGQALPSVSMSSGIGLLVMGDDVPAPVFNTLDEVSPEDLKTMARVTRGRGRGLEGIGAQTTTDGVEACASFLDRYASASRFQLKKGPDGNASAFNRDIQRAHWLIQNDLTRYVTLGCGTWDTHAMNTMMQTKTTARHIGAIADFLSRLETTTNEHGSLMDNTLVILASEIGRFPVLNKTEGKDHFPETPFIFINAEGAGRVFGTTGRRMQALPFPKRRTGKVYLTDVGATILRISGVNPETCGYEGEPLDFLGA